MSLTLNAAQAMIERARAHATDIGVPMNIAVTTTSSSRSGGN